MIQPEVIDDMTISIYDTLPKTQTFVPFKDSESISYNSPGFCGPKQYTISNAMTQIAQPVSNLVDTDPWTISAVANTNTLVASYVVTVTASMSNYSGVAAKSVTFNLLVIDNCATAQVTSQNQVLNDMIYVPLVSISSSEQTF